LELSADYRVEELHGGDIEAAVIPVRASAVLNLLPGVSPYLLAGVGADIASLSFHNAHAGTADESDILYEAHAGAGIEIGLGPVSLVGDLRYVAATTLDAAAVAGVLGHAYDPSGWYVSIAAGLSF
jgi:hypothetical protein